MRKNNDPIKIATKKAIQNLKKVTTTYKLMK